MKFDAEFPNSREGVFVPANFATPQEIVEVVQFAEDLGYHALWATDFITSTPEFGIPKGEKPNWYEPLATIAFCLARTERIKLGTGLILAPFRDPVILAKQVATIDRFSDGRFFLGLGLGMSRGEFAVVKPRDVKAHRGRMMDECIELLRRFFSDEIDVKFDGRYHSVDGVNLYPKPSLDPFPIYVPCRGENAYERVARWGLGITAPALTVARHAQALRPLLEAQNHDPTQLDVVAEGEALLGADREALIERYKNTRHGQFRLARQDLDAFLENNWVGSKQEVIDKLGKLKEQGIDHFNVLHIPCDTMAERKELLQQFAEEVIPALL
ncbi:MAG: LLM class flavin-dependent oxidoreductase [Gammaproteobacteria bacterium]|nr:LLM class flavin-dependent oxidoreductase [Gammaproteobacteria bacterium]